MRGENGDAQGALGLQAGVGGHVGQGDALGEKLVLDSLHVFGCADGQADNRHGRVVYVEAETAEAGFQGLRVSAQSLSQTGIGHDDLKSLGRGGGDRCGRGTSAGEIGRVGFDTINEIAIAWDDAAESADSFAQSAGEEQGRAGQGGIGDLVIWDWGW